MQDLDSFLMFADVASQGSFSEATRRTGVPKATLSRRIQKLEGDLGVRLLQRNTRAVSLTEAGRAFHEHCIRIASEVELAKASIADLGAAPRGVLRVSAPFTAARSLVVPMLPDFLSRYPKVRIALTLRNDAESLVSQQADVVLTAATASNAPDVTQASRLLLCGQTHLHASPAYLQRRGAPASPRELAPHDLLLYSRTPAGTPPILRLRAGAAEEVIEVAPVLTSNDIGPLFASALAGKGILLAPDQFVIDEVSAGHLVQVLPEWAGPEIELRAVFGSRRGLAPKVRVFLDCLAERCETLRSWAPARIVEPAHVDAPGELVADAAGLNPRPSSDS